MVFDDLVLKFNMSGPYHNVDCFYLFQKFMALKLPESHKQRDKPIKAANGEPCICLPIKTSWMID